MDDPHEEDSVGVYDGVWRRSLEDDLVPKVYGDIIRWEHCRPWCDLLVTSSGDVWSVA